MDKDYRSLEHKIRDLMMETMARNSAKRMQVTNVARPDTATDPTDVKSKIAKQGEIKTKIIDEESDAPEVADKKEKKKKKGDDDTAPKKSKSDEMDDKDAKEIKGGKTEVDTEPRTDDTPEEQSVEDSKSKKATKDENKKIGAKSGVKEEMTKNTPFGLPQGLIDTVAEALKGNQHKIDANHNGKVDGQDFKILRGETKAKAKPQYDKTRPAFKEEAEVVSEGGLVRPAKIEVKKQSLGDGSHVTRISHGASHGYVLHPEHSAAVAKLGDGEHTKFKDETGNKVTAHRQGEKIHLTGDPAATGTTKTTVDRKHFTEEAEQVEEASYSAKAAAAGKDIGKPGKQFKKIASKAAAKYGSKESGERVAGAILKNLRKEETEVSEEQLNELSPKTLRSYASKAQRQVDYTDTRGFGTKGGGVPVYYKGKKKELGKDPVKVYKNRKAGAEQAWKKSHKTNEEVQLSAEEQARIDAIAKGME